MNATEHRHPRTSLLDLQPSADAPGGEPGGSARPRLPEWARALMTPVAFLLSLAAASGVALGLTTVLGVRSAGENGGWLETAVRFGVSLVMSLVVTGGAWLLMRFVDRAPLRRLGLLLTARSVPLLLLGTAVSAAICWAVLGVGRILGQLPDTPAPSVHGGSGVLAFIASGLIAGYLAQAFPEELFFRGYLLQSLGWRPARAAWVSASLFAVIHLISQGGQDTLVERLLYLSLPFGFGLLAASLALRLRSLWVAVGVHGGAHLAAIPAALAGIALDRPFYWVGVGVLYAAAALLVLRHHGRERVVLDR